jgi:hypothetical protein
VQKGIQSVKFNGQELNGNLIPFEQAKNENVVEVIMG